MAPIVIAVVPCAFVVVPFAKFKYKFTLPSYSASYKYKIDVPLQERSSRLMYVRSAVVQV